MRFAFMDEQGRQVHVASMEDLAQHVRQGDVGDDTELYDALEDRWAPAREHPMYVSARDAAQGPGQAPGASSASGTPASPPVAAAPPGPSTRPTHSRAPAPDPSTSGGATAEDEAALSRDWSSALKDEFLGAVPGPGPAGPGPAQPAAEGSPGGRENQEPLEPTSFTHDILNSQDLDDARGGPRTKGDMETVAGASNVFSGLDAVVTRPPPPEGSIFEDPGRADDRGMEFEEFMPSPQAGPSAPPPARPNAPGPSLDDEGDEDFFLIEDPSLSEEAAEGPTVKRGRSRGTGKKMLKAVVALASFALLMSVAVPRLVEIGSAFMATRGTDEGPVEPGDGLSDQLKTEAFFLAARAQEDAFASLDSIRRNLGVEASPPGAWMEGIYFAHASRYPAAQSYWERYGSYMRYGQRELPALFESAFRRQVSASAIVPSAQEDVIELVMTDFESRVPTMSGAFQDLIGLADAALELHAFLVLKEDEIEYTPFTRSGVSRDPIVEAVPATEQTRVDFWNRLEQVTDRLEALDA
ncbi:MAG: hypothetical protein HKN73_09420, partial [Gemmatimonadetes bacterium]|nr:hypothetical protein [Gemmatimonadota bacterium]